MANEQRLIELLDNSQQNGVIYEQSQMDDRKLTTKHISNAEVADNLIANGVTIPVRCHECRSWERNIANQKEYGTCYCRGFSRGIPKHENGYCDSGKRRDDHGQG